MGRASLCYSTVPLMLLLFVGTGTEHGARNVAVLMMIFGGVGLVMLVIVRLGFFEAWWRLHVSATGENWFAALIFGPFAVALAVLALDMVVRGDDSVLVRVGRRLARSGAGVAKSSLPENLTF